MKSDILKKFQRCKIWGIHHLFVIAIFLLIVFTIISQVFINREHSEVKLKRQLLYKQFFEQTDKQN